jgi:hypothetical protein
MDQDRYVTAPDGERFKVLAVQPLVVILERMDGSTARVPKMLVAEWDGAEGLDLT